MSSNFYEIAKKLTFWRWKAKPEPTGDYSGADTVEERELTHGPLSGAELIGSELRDKPGKHALVIDLDVPAALVPSSTPGHSHLYIEAEMSMWQLDNVLRALADAGIVEDGYYLAALRRKATYVRAPWNQKDPDVPVSVTGMALLGDAIMKDAENDAAG